MLQRADALTDNFVPGNVAERYEKVND